MAVHPIILCGGPGARLWPASTAAHPKPFIELFPGESLFQKTLARVAAIPGAQAPVVITGIEHAEQAIEQMRACGIEGVVLVEPAGRDSAAALMAATLWIAQEDPLAVALAVASDHHIPDVKAFAAGVADSIAATQNGEIVTFGVRPTSAATAYGYIQAGDPLGEMTAVLRVRRFVEKPDRLRAEAMLRTGYLWNSGNFVFRVDTLLRESDALAGEILRPVRAAVDEAETVGGAVRLGQAFLEAPRRSIDVAVMEKTSHAAVLPIDYAWSDLGSWDAVWEVSARNADGNAVHGNAVLLNSQDCLVRAGGSQRIVVTGLSKIAVVVQGGEILVSAFGHADLMKPALSALPAVSPLIAPSLAPMSDRLDQWLETQALPTWWTFGADHVRGGFHETLTADYAPCAADRRARVQARQIFVYARAGERGWAGPWKSAVEHGLEYLTTAYRRADGLYRAEVTAAGEIADNTAKLYDQAFVLLALGSAAAALPDRFEEMRDLASKLLVATKSVFTAPNGGFFAIENEAKRAANPLMHLFEAALAWVEIDPTGPWNSLADEIARLFIDRLCDPKTGRVLEVFDEQWSPSALAEDRYLEPGHHFEWAWLIGRWGRAKGDETAEALASLLFAVGEAGVDPDTGLVVDRLNEDLTVLRGSARLWPQTERVKAALWLDQSVRSPEEDFRSMALESADVLQRYLRLDAPGLWTDAARRSKVVAVPALASSFYHLMGAIDALYPRPRAASAI